jgi:ribosomal-protein-alanine N-acetyltransferase
LSCLVESDIDAVLDIETVSFPSPWGRVSFEGELSEKTSRSLVIKKGRREKPDRVIAYLLFRLLEDEMHIMNLAVDPDYRRRGVAVFLLGYGLRLANKYGAKRAFLEVRASNHAAIKLYRKMDFCEAGRRQRYYLETQEDAVVMIYDMVGAVRQNAQE